MIDPKVLDELERASQSYAENHDPLFPISTKTLIALLAAAREAERLREALRHNAESHESLVVLLGNGSRITTQGYVAAVCQCEKYAAEARTALAQGDRDGK